MHQDASGARGELEARLRKRLEQMRSMSAHEIFGLWPGCGRAEVTKRYPELVKRNHPDRYGGNVSGEIKRLSHDIFLLIQRARKELLRTETKQTVPRHKAHATPAAGIPIADAAQSVTRVFEAETRSTRPPSAAWSDSESIPTEERRERLARLARSARPRRPQRPVVISEPIGLEEDSALSQQERRERLAQLAKRAQFASARPSGTHRRITRASGAHTVAAENDVMKIGLAALHRGDYSVALEQFERARAKRPDDALLEMLSAYTSFRADPGQAADAERRLRAVVERKDRQAAPNAHLYLGYVLDSFESETKKREAYRHFKQALALNPASREAERMIRLYRARHNNPQDAASLADEVSNGSALLRKIFKKK